MATITNIKQHNCEPLSFMNSSLSSIEDGFTGLLPSSFTVANNNKSYNSPGFESGLCPRSQSIQHDWFAEEITSNSTLSTEISNKVLLKSFSTPSTVGQESSQDDRSNLTCCPSTDSEILSSAENSICSRQDSLHSVENYQGIKFSSEGEYSSDDYYDTQGSDYVESDSEEDDESLTLVPVVLTYNSQIFNLFYHSTGNSGSSVEGEQETLFLEDTSLYKSNLSTFMEALQCHFHISTDISLHFQQLKLKFSKHMVFSQQLSLSDLSFLFTKMCKTDPVIHIHLEVEETCFVDQYNHLLKLVQIDDEGSLSEDSSEAEDEKEAFEVESSLAVPTAMCPLSTSIVQPFPHPSANSLVGKRVRELGGKDDSWVSQEAKKPKV